MNQHEPSFRTATSEDLVAVITLLEQSNLPTAGVPEMFARDAAQFVVALDSDEGDAIVAAAGIEVCSENALLRSVVVRDDWQRRGLGRSLIRRAVCEAESRGIRALYLLTLTAEHYFPRFGFERIERQQVPAEIADTLEFKSACPASAIAMTKSLALQNA